ncbi:hypothetical protein BpHYR1_032326 [Brachionus plicatilis]|uniref:Uncharacterized protein n=1 Tax=Brachionus plicatilis TaxID=10195 RepID=A0A3M7T0X4_BRAPC|nr:hypothetical protein BpHYR1_032326 [Brachionus plicatilis]
MIFKYSLYDLDWMYYNKTFVYLIEKSFLLTKQIIRKINIKSEISEKNKNVNNFCYKFNFKSDKCKQLANSLDKTSLTIY